MWLPTHCILSCEGIMNKHDSRHPLVQYFIIFIIITALFAIGCGGGGGGGNLSSSTQQTISDVLSSLSKAAVSGDNSTALSYFTQPAREILQIPLSNKDDMLILG